MRAGDGRGGGGIGSYFNTLQELEGATDLGLRGRPSSGEVGTAGPVDRPGNHR